MALPIGYVRHSKHLTAARQVAILMAAGVDRIRIHVHGDGAECLLSAINSIRAKERLLWCARGMRALGDSMVQIREAMVLVKKKRVIIYDPETKLREDRDGYLMYSTADRQIRTAKTGINPDRSARGGAAIAAKRKADRLADDKARVVWTDPKIPTDAQACAKMNRLHQPKIYGGWNPGLAYRLFGSSKRPRGRRKAIIPAKNR